MWGSSLKNDSLHRLNNIEKKIIDLLPECIALVTHEGKILQINTKMSQSLTGKNINPIGENIIKYLPKEVAEQRTKLAQRAIKTKKPVCVIDNRDDQWFKSSYIPIVDSNGKAIQLLITANNITKNRDAEKIIQSQYEFRTLISRISSDFINMPIEKIDVGIHNSLKEIAEFVGVVRSALFVLHDNQKRVTNTHEWCKNSRDSQIDDLHDIPFETFGYYADLLRNRENVVIGKTKDLSQKATSEWAWIKKHGFRPLLFIPVLFEDSLYGALGFYGRVDEEIEWSSEFIQLLKFAGDVFVNALERKKTTNKVMKERDLAQKYLDIAGFIFIALDTEGIVTLVNRKGCEILGYNDKEIIGKNWFDNFVPKETKKTIVPLSKKVLTDNSKSVSYFENPILTKNGEQRLIAWNTTAINDEKGNIIGHLSSGEDITERKKAEKDLKDTLNATTEGIWTWNYKTDQFSFSDRYYTMLGYTPQEFSASYDNWMGLIHPDDRENALSVAETYLKTKPDKYENQFRLRTKKGDYRWIRALAYVVDRDEKGNAVIIIGNHEDITDRKKAENELTKYRNHLEELVKKRTAELGKTYKKLNSVINSALEIIISFDENKKVTTWNKTAELLTGYKLKEIIGKPPNKLDVFDDPKAMIDAITTVYDKKNRLPKRIVLRTKNGDKRIICLSGSAIIDDHKRRSGCLFIGKDITNDIESHGKLLKGHSYLIPDRNDTPAVSLFTSFMNSGYKGLFITRGAPTNIKSMVSSANAEIVLLKQKKTGDFKNISDFKSLIEKIKEFSKTNINSIILLDRVDYLLTNFSFEQFAKSLYQITDIISENNSLLLLHLNPSIVDTRQLAIIEDELQLLPSQKIEDIEISDDLYNILKFIYEKNQKNAIASVKKIGKEFSIVDKTTTKRLRNLEGNGLIYIKKIGRTKTLHTSEKGKAMLHIRKFI